MKIKKLKHNAYAVTLLKSEIAYDVEIASYKIAKTHLAESTNQQQHEAVVNEEVNDWLERTIETAWAKVRRTLGFCVRDYDIMTDDEIIVSKPSWSIALYMENGWLGNAETLCNLIHDYVAKFCISEWLLMVMPTRAAEYAALADISLDQALSEARSVEIEPEFYRF